MKLSKLSMGWPTAGCAIKMKSSATSRVMSVLAIARHQVAFPSIGRFDDFVEVVMLGHPAEQAAHLFAGGGDRRRIARTPRAFLRYEVDPRDRTHRFPHLPHRIALAIGAVERRALPTLAQVLEQQRMGGDQVGDVDIVAYAGTIGR